MICRTSKGLICWIVTHASARNFAVCTPMFALFFKHTDWPFFITNCPEMEINDKNPSKFQFYFPRLQVKNWYMEFGDKQIYSFGIVCNAVFLSPKIRVRRRPSVLIWSSKTKKLSKKILLSRPAGLNWNLHGFCSFTFAFEECGYGCHNSIDL